MKFSTYITPFLGPNLGYTPPLFVPIILRGSEFYLHHLWNYSKQRWAWLHAVWLSLCVFLFVVAREFEINSVSSLVGAWKFVNGYINLPFFPAIASNYGNYLGSVIIATCTHTWFL